MRFAEMIAHVQSRTSTDDATTLPRIKREINLVLNEIEAALPDAYWLRAERRFGTIGKITDGAVDVTKGSVAVAKNGGTSAAAWLNQIQDAWFKADSDTDWYRIARWTSNTAFELEYPYIGTTGVAKTYQICKVEYALPGDFARMRHLVQYQTPTRIVPVRQRDAAIALPDILGEGNVDYPVFWWFTDLTREANYSSNTIAAATQGSRTITGNSTTWNATAFNPSGQFFKIDEDEEGYVIERATGATTLILQEPYRGASFSTASKSYQIGPPGLQKIALYPIPTANQIINIAYIRKMPELIADDSEPILPRQYHVAVMRLAETRMLAHLGDTPAAQQAERMMLALLSDLRSEGQERDQDYIPRMRQRPEYSWQAKYGPRFQLPGNYEPWSP